MLVQLARRCDALNEPWHKSKERQRQRQSDGRDNRSQSRSRPVPPGSRCPSLTCRLHAVGESKVFNEWISLRNDHDRLSRKTRSLQVALDETCRHRPCTSLLRSWRFRRHPTSARCLAIEKTYNTRYTLQQTTDMMSRSDARQKPDIAVYSSGWAKTDIKQGCDSRPLAQLISRFDGTLCPALFPPTKSHSRAIKAGSVGGSRYGR